MNRLSQIQNVRSAHHIKDLGKVHPGNHIKEEPLEISSPRCPPAGRECYSSNKLIDIKVSNASNQMTIIAVFFSTRAGIQRISMWHIVFDAKYR